MGWLFSGLLEGTEQGDKGAGVVQRRIQGHLVLFCFTFYVLNCTVGG